MCKDDEGFFILSLNLSVRGGMKIFHLEDDQKRILKQLKQMSTRWKHVFK